MPAGEMLLQSAYEACTEVHLVDAEGMKREICFAPSPSSYFES